jgi:thymidylate synthase (FAD)
MHRLKIIDPYVEITEFSPGLMLKRLEKAGRTCYKTEDKISLNSAETFLKMISGNGHHSVLEHEQIQVRFICDRGVTHELVRHRIAAYSQESTRYCNYGAEKFGNELTFIRPFFFKNNNYEFWKIACEKAEEYYLGMLRRGASPQEARSVLPNSLKTEIVATMNIRQWRNVFAQRCSVKAHPQMRQIMIPLLLKLAGMLPVLFGDIDFDREFNFVNYAQICMAG